MERVEELLIELTPDMVAELRAAVAEGAYASVSEVVRDVLTDWHLCRRVGSLPADDLRRQVQEGIDSGPGLEAVDVFDRLRIKYGSPPAV